MLLPFKILIVFVLLAWFATGVWGMLRYKELFGPNRDHLSETAGARSFGVAQIAAVWVGGIALGIYFLSV